MTSETQMDRTAEANWSACQIVSLAVALRLLLVSYGRIHDYYFDVKFTDIDYSVFSDAARIVGEGGSPFERATYRYSPVVAFLLVPNGVLPEFGAADTTCSAERGAAGKLLFNCFDLAVAWLIWRLVLVRGGRGADGGQRAALAASAVWLFNPLTAVISSRGNADALSAAAVLLVLLLLTKERDSWFAAAVVHGAVAVHLRIYPLVYLPSVYLSFVRQPLSPSWHYCRALLINWRGIGFAAVSLASFGVVTLFWYELYGDQFLNESLLYHFGRLDARHNFSPYFYLVYLADGRAALLRLIGLLAFLPQLCLTVIFAFRYSHDLAFCWFATTFAFVSLNKVCTSQYFVWYLCLLPVVLPTLRRRVRPRAAVAAALAWVGAQALWLLAAYLLEFGGSNTFHLVWLASLLFLAVNCCILKLFLSAANVACKTD